MTADCISHFAKQNNCLWGVCGVEPLTRLPERLAGRFVPFAQPDLSSRPDLEKLLPGAQSMIVFGLPYARPKKNLFPTDTENGKITAMAAGCDYHKILRGILSKWADSLHAESNGTVKIFVDSGVLLEKEWAVRSGLGFWGKNCLVISPDKGSFFTIGCALTDVAIKKPTSVSRSGGCGDCRRCIQACPAQAIAGNGYELDIQKCVSYLTQKGGALTQNERRTMGAWLYGCDVCQQVCPYNADPYDSPRVSLSWILNMTPDVFQNTMGKTAAGWRGLRLMQRNAAFALENRRMK